MYMNDDYIQVVVYNISIYQAKRDLHELLLDNIYDIHRETYVLSILFRIFK